MGCNHRLVHNTVNLIKIRRYTKKCSGIETFSITSFLSRLRVKNLHLLQTIAEAVGDWYFSRDRKKEIDCAYPCDRTCKNLIPASGNSLINL